MRFPRGPRPWLGLLLIMATVGHAQTHDHSHATPPTASAAASSAATPPPDASGDDWKAANDAVGELTRGHIDILRWEQAQTPRAPAIPQVRPAAWTLAQAIESAMHARPDLLARPGMNPMELAALRLQAQALAHEVERAWIRAVAARQSLGYRQQVLEAAEAGTELARRMAQVGNWSAARQIQEELTLWDARAEYLQARHTEAVAREGLWRLLGRSDAPTAPDLARRLPDRLGEPPIPEAMEANTLAALETQALQRHPRWPLLALEARRQVQGLSATSREWLERVPAASIESADGQWPATLDRRQPWPHAVERAAQARAEADALERRIRSDLRVALDAWRTAHAMAQQARQDVQRLHTALQEDAVQRYNGMLASTWDLLASARTRVRSVEAALQAERDAWLAHADLQAVLAGLPYTGQAPTAPGATDTPSKGH
jgi:outer membrane protein, multidrug efflux system